MRMIDADALKEELKEIYHTEPVFIYTTVHEAIDNAPTVEPWWDEILVICDNCGHAIHIKKDGDER